MEQVRAEGEKAARPGRVAPATRRRTERDDTGSRARPLVCVRCRRPVTTAGDRIEVHGLHEHTQINPHGFIWSFGCFARAPGFMAVGAPSHEFTWFSGHAWQIGHCVGCGLHLGWLFTSPDRSFYGLIVGRVVEQEQGDDHERGTPPEGPG